MAFQALTKLIRAVTGEPPPPIKQLTCFLVRTGKYPLPNGGRLTDTGRQQATAAATHIHGIVGGRPIAVLLSQFNPVRPCYNQTAEIIARALNAPVDLNEQDCIELILDKRKNALDDFDRDSLFTLRRLARSFDANDLRLILVVNGPLLNRLLRAYPGPKVEADYMGPPYGSVHQLITKYERKTGKIISRHFV